MDPEIELRHLRSFAAVAERLHFGRAAQQLHLAQPALSQQIRKLEDVLGSQLFLRTSRSVALTSAGEVLQQRVAGILQSLGTAVAEARSVARGEMGSLNVGFIGSGMLTSFAVVLQRYRKQYPNVHLQLHESYTAQVLQGLAKGTLDAGLLRDSDPEPGIHREPLFTEPFLAVVPRQHPLACRKRIAASQLRDEPFVFYARSAGALAHDKPLSLCAREGFRPRVVQEASNWLTILRLIEAGLGVSIAPACVRAIASRQVACLPLTGALQHSVVELAFRDGEQRPVVQQFASLTRSLTSPARGARPRRASNASSNAT